MQSRVSSPTNLDSRTLVELHDSIRHGCHRCQLRTGILWPTTSVPVHLTDHTCEALPTPPWASSFAETALFTTRSKTDVPRGLLCFSCRSRQTFCRSQHPSNPYDLLPCLYKVSSPPPNLHPGSSSLWSELVFFLLSTYAAKASDFVLSHATASQHRPPPSWRSSATLTPLDFSQWFSHTGPGMDPPSNLTACTNGACLVVYLFNIHFRPS